jgi:hypothetical protein
VPHIREGVIEADAWPLMNVVDPAGVPIVAEDGGS